MPAIHVVMFSSYKILFELVNLPATDFFLHKTLSQQQKEMTINYMLIIVVV